MFKELFEAKLDMKKEADKFKKAYRGKDLKDDWELHKAELYDAGLITAEEYAKWGNPFMNEALEVYRLLVSDCAGKQRKVKPADFLDIHSNLNDKNCEIKVQFGSGKVDLGKTTIYKKTDDVWYLTQKNGKKMNQKVKATGQGRNISIDYI